YKNVPNIIWMSGNDFQSWHNPDDDALARAVAEGIRDTAPNMLQTVELDYFRSSSLDNAAWRPLIQVDLVYTYYPTYAEVQKEYSRPDFKPVVLIEANYEFENNFSPVVTGPQILRRQAYWTMLSGAAGQFYGNKYTWQFAHDWK